MKLLLIAFGCFFRFKSSSLIKVLKVFDSYYKYLVKKIIINTFYKLINNNYKLRIPMNIFTKIIYRTLKIFKYSNNNIIPCKII